MNPIDFYVTHKNTFELVKDTIVILGVIIGVGKYWQAKQREAREASYRTYDEVDNKYYEYQRLCLQHPDLDIGPTPVTTSKSADAAIRRREMLAFSLLFSLFERTFLMYKDHSSRLKQSQWVGWDAYIKRHCPRDNVREAWEAIGYSYDADFQEYMNQCFRTCGGSENLDNAEATNPD